MFWCLEERTQQSMMAFCNHTLRANHRIYPDINTIFISLQSAPSTPKLRSDILKRLHIESISQSQPFRNRKVRKKTDIQRTAYQKVGFGLLGGTGVIYHPIWISQYRVKLSERTRSRSVKMSGQVYVRSLFSFVSSTENMLWGDVICVLETLR